MPEEEYSHFLTKELLEQIRKIQLGKAAKEGADLTNSPKQNRDRVQRTKDQPNVSGTSEAFSQDLESAKRQQREANFNDQRNRQKKIEKKWKK